MSLLEDFIGYMKMKLGDAGPILVETRVSAFAPFWHDYVTTISTYLEGIANKRVADTHNELLYKLPAIAVVPRNDYYIAFAKNPKNVDDIYLAYNTAYVSYYKNTHFYVVPYMKTSSIEKLCRKNVNPAVLQETLYLLPYLAAIACTSLKDEIKLIRELLLVRSYSYLLSDDVAQNVLGYILLKMTKMNEKNYRTVFEIIINFLKEVFINLEVIHRIEEVMVRYYGITIDLKVIIIQ